MAYISSLPTSKHEVEQVQNNLLSAITFTTEAGENSYLNETITRLDNLRKVLISQETSFFSTFPYLNGKTHKEALLRLQETLDKLDEIEGGFGIFINDFNEEKYNKIFNSLVRGAMIGIDFAQNVEFMFKEGTYTKETFENVFGDVKSFTGAEFAKALEGLPNLTIDKSRTNIKASEKVGIASSIDTVSFSLEEKKGKVTIKFNKGGRKFSTADKNRLEKEYGLLLQNVKDPKDILREELKKVINPILWPYVEYQFNQNYDKYSVNHSASSIKGFLGELRVNALFDYIYQQKGTSAPTGAIIKTNIAGHQEIPIDSVIRGAGFQIKNYQLHSNVAMFSYKQGMGSFINDRARIDGMMHDLVSLFFGAYQYNQPVENATQEYIDIYNVFEQKKNEVANTVFSQYIDNIMKVTDVFSGNDPLFGDNRVYYNTFFMIQNKLVPGSAIINGIIMALKNIGENKLVQSSFTVLNPSDSPKWTSMGPHPSYNDALDAIKIEGKVFLDVQKVINDAYSYVIS